ncbi:uncharacterized protein LOC112002895 [Quercus suber]|uniref:uncharacterized protein LOC112002895 n=1 Tax=Quercus suber TaxID=58331 RepID=UPI0032E01B43
MGHYSAPINFFDNYSFVHVISLLIGNSRSAGRTSVVCKEFWRTALKVVAAGLPRIIDHFTIIGTLIKDQSFGLYK